MRINFGKLFQGPTRIAAVDFGYAIHMEKRGEYIFETDPNAVSINQFPVFEAIRIGNEVYLKAGAKLINQEAMDAHADKLEAGRNEGGEDA